MLGNSIFCGATSTQLPRIITAQCREPESSQKFLADWDTRRAREKDYTRLLQELLQDFRVTARSLVQERPGLQASVDNLAKDLAGTPEALQHAHRELLLRLESAK